jgi:hypothetical protein
MGAMRDKGRKGVKRLEKGGNYILYSLFALAFCGLLIASIGMASSYRARDYKAGIGFDPTNILTEFGIALPTDSPPLRGMFGIM